MKHKVWKFFGFWQHEKEEIWLNEMSVKGLQLASVSFCTYFFDESCYNEYTYRLELLNGWLYSAENMAYIRFLKETGIEHVATLGRWGYFRKKTTEGAFEMYSDNASKIKHYRRIIQMIILMGLANILQIPNSLHRVLDWHYSDGQTGFIVILAIQLILTSMLILGIISLYRKIRKLKKDSKLSE